MFAEVTTCLTGKVVLQNEQINDQQIVEISGRRNNKIKGTEDEVQLVCRKCWALNLRRWIKALNARAKRLYLISYFEELKLSFNNISEVSDKPSPVSEQMGIRRPTVVGPSSRRKLIDWYYKVIIYGQPKLKSTSEDRYCLFRTKPQPLFPFP